ncbi:MAG: hypothetical protein ACOYJZ_04235 [Acutalibacter sp.]
MDEVTRALAPAMAEFVQWTLESALRRGISRLYFLSRDGWTPWRMASLFCREWRLPLECRYLYGSRRAWRLPLYHRDPSRAVEQLCAGPAVIPGAVLEGAGLSPEERREVLFRLGIPGEEPVPWDQREGFSLALLECPLFQELLDSRSRWALPLLLGYLSQEGLLDGEDWALVDSGWMGTTQETLGETLSLLGGPGKVRGLYAGLYRAPDRGAWDACFFRPGRELSLQAKFEPSLWEAISAAPQGMTLGYSCRDGEFYPLLGQPPLTAWRTARLGDAFLRYAKELARSGWMGGRDSDRGAASLVQVMTRPTLAQARELGALPFSPRAVEGSAGRLAPWVDWEGQDPGGLLPRLLGRREELPSPWMPGSAALYSVHPQREFRALNRRRWARVLSLAWRYPVKRREGSSWKKGESGDSIGSSSNSSPCGS